MYTRDELFNPLDADVLADPYPTYRRLRETHPAYWHAPLQCWVLTRYADCRAVLSDSDRFANDFRRIGISTPPTLLNLQTLDPPEQTPLRRFAQTALGAQDFSALAENATDEADALLGNLASHQTIDFVRDFADPFTLGVSCSLLGVEPPEQTEAWRRLNDDLDQSMDSGLVPGSQESGLRARALFSALVANWLAGKPTKGLLGYILDNRASIDISDGVLINSIRAFWHAGFEVPSRFLGNALLTLLRHNDAMTQLRRGASLELAVEELVRYVGPVQAVSRGCVQEVPLGGRDMRKGDVVVVVIAAADRDPEQFQNPDELVLERIPNPHLGFGTGAHSCLGLQVARMEARVVISTILRQYPEIQLTGEPTFRSNATLRGLASLPVKLGS